MTQDQIVNMLLSKAVIGICVLGVGEIQYQTMVIGSKHANTYFNGIFASQIWSYKSH